MIHSWYSLNPPKILVEFRAGRMIEGNRFLIEADKSKGLIQLIKIGEKIHFFWKDRTTFIIEEHFIINQYGCVEVSWVKQCTTGRVLLIEIVQKGSLKQQAEFVNKRHFYWLQDPPNLEHDYESYSRLKFYIGDKTPIEDFNEFKTHISTPLVKPSEKPSKIDPNIVITNQQTEKFSKNEKFFQKSNSKRVKEIDFQEEETGKSEKYSNFINIRKDASEDEIWDILEKAETEHENKKPKRPKLFPQVKMDEKLITEHKSTKISGINSIIRTKCAKKLLNYLIKNLGDKYM